MDTFELQLRQLVTHCFDEVCGYVDIEPENIFVEPFYDVLRQLGLTWIMNLEFKSAGDFMLVNFRDDNYHFVLFERGAVVDFHEPGQSSNKEFIHLVWEMSVLEGGHRIFGYGDYVSNMDKLPNVDWRVLDLLERSCKLHDEINNFLKMTTRME